jgi:hypothetical protein
VPRPERRKPFVRIHDRETIVPPRRTRTS